MWKIHCQKTIQNFWDAILVGFVPTIAGQVVGTLAGKQRGPHLRPAHHDQIHHAAA
jgi:hypothetical protein